MNPALYDSLTYDMQRDFAPVSLVVNNVEVLVVNPANPATSVTELVAQSKQNPNPVPIASSGIGSMPHLAMELLADSSGAKLMHVPYKGAAPAITDVMGGQVSGFFGDIPGLIGFIRGGRLKPLGIAAPSRHPLLPDVRTLDEQGIHVGLAGPGDQLVHLVGRLEAVVECINPDGAQLRGVKRGRSNRRLRRQRRWNDERGGRWGRWTGRGRRAGRTDTRAWRRRLRHAARRRRGGRARKQAAQGDAEGHQQHDEAGHAWRAC